MSVNGRYQQIPTVEAAPLEDGMILLDPETNQFSVLNQTAVGDLGEGRPAGHQRGDRCRAPARFDEVDGGVLSDVEDTLRQMVERRLIKQV